MRRRVDTGLTGNQDQGKVVRQGNELRGALCCTLHYGYVGWDNGREVDGLGGPGFRMYRRGPAPSRLRLSKPGGFPTVDILCAAKPGCAL